MEPSGRALNAPQNDVKPVTVTCLQTWGLSYYPVREGLQGMLHVKDYVKRLSNTRAGKSVLHRVLQKKRSLAS